jgi:putative ABC transport system ATP-binding protein
MSQVLPTSPLRTVGSGVADMIVCDNLVKIYRIGGREVMALQGLDLRIAPAELVGIVGKSGSGKSTLLNILSGNDIPTSGKARVGEHNLLSLSPKRLAQYRRYFVGFVWQQTGRNLLPYLSALQNVEQPLYYAGVVGRKARMRAEELLRLVGLEGRLHHQPSALSGGEQQRVAIAVALVNNPKVLLADEPTGELDSTTAQEVLGVLKLAREQLGVTVVVVTHDAAVADVADRTIAIRDGRTSTERVRVTPATASRGALDATHLEYVVVDRAGRLQIPQEYLRVLGIKDRAVLRLDDRRLIIEPVRLPVPHEEAHDTGLRIGQSAQVPASPTEDGSA